VIEILMAGLMGLLLGWIGKGQLGAKTLRDQHVVWQSRVDAVQSELIEARRHVVELQRKVGEFDGEEQAP